MSIRIRLRKNEIKSNRNYGQYFAETVSMGTVGVEQMAEEISRNCTLKSSDVQGALIALQEVMASFPASAVSPWQPRAAAWKTRGNSTCSATSAASSAVSVPRANARAGRTVLSSMTL